MSHTTDTLETKVEAIESKALTYETATNFEAKKQEYLNELSSMESSLDVLAQRAERMEFLASVLVDVLEARRSVPQEVEDARARVRSVIDYDADEYYRLVEQGDTEEYERPVQQAEATADDAVDVLEAQLRTEEDDWTERVNAAKDVQRLFGDSMDILNTLSEIELFVKRRMWDDSESVTALSANWQGLKKNWERSGADWETFQTEYGLSDRTIDILQELAMGSDIKLEQLDERTMSELLAVEDLQDVVKLTI